MEDEIGPLYCAIMEELKARVQTMKEITEGIRVATNEQHHRHNIFFFEGLYLQLRKSLELLAIGMLVSQSDHKDGVTAELFAEYRADKLLKRLLAINPTSFPRPVLPGNWLPDTVEYVAGAPPVFTAKEIKEAYFVCDERMHSGRLRSLLAGKKRELNQDMLKAWVEKLMVGLANHKIDLPKEGRSMLVQMSDPECGRVNCRFASLAT